AAGVLGRLALAVVEIGRHGDDGLLHFFAEIVLGDHFHFLQDVGADLGDRKDLVAQHDAYVVVRSLDDFVGDRLHRRLHRRRIPLAADEPLGREHRVLGVRDGLPFGDVTDEPLAVFRDRNHRRCGLVAAAVWNHYWGPVLDHRYAGVRRTEVD